MLIPILSDQPQHKPARALQGEEILPRVSSPT